MFLTVTATGTPDRPATDLGFLLHKHPDRAQSFSTSHGTAHVFYPEATTERCTAALLLEVDPVALVRRGRGKGRGGAPDSALAQYVNDRPYVASSLLAVALGRVFSSALKGQCTARPELPGRPVPLRVEVPVLPARGGPELVGRLFAPLGWRAEAVPVPLDEQFPEWGDSRYVRLTMDAELRLVDALRHLYVLLPVLDDAKHYWVAPDEVDKLLRSGDGWLEDHPEQRLITSRYLARRRGLTRDALERLELARLAEADDAEPEAFDNAVAGDEADPADDADATTGATADTPAQAPATVPAGNARVAGVPPRAAAAPRAAGAPQAADAASATGTPPAAGTPHAGDAAEQVPLGVRRREAILDALRSAGATRVLDLGCGEGQLVAALLGDTRFTEIVGVDVSMRALTVAARRLRLDRLSDRQAERVTLFQGSLAYTDSRLTGYDAAVLSEVIEHLDPPRLPALEYAVFGAARPRCVVVTTPNAEYNVRWPTLPAGHVRHPDHRFEWPREEFRRWASTVAGRYGYDVAFLPVGPDDPEVGPPTQLALFHAAPAPDDGAGTGDRERQAGTPHPRAAGDRSPAGSAPPTSTASTPTSTMSTYTSSTTSATTVKEATE